ncbi:DegV family protein [Oscillibacter sp.]|jgi:DegV family protein with EDD domain|uniref:DegV family protein n=1 Tax=Oscillibacter sp. TaxID=1945593 RepID=UPI0021733EDA|nr:DegV family protein [Oscillibacter sp.]MCI9648162.1 DegV family protein [Oscillibacter sp.]
MKIRVITDSAADLPQPCRPEITVLPMAVTFGEEQFLDGVDLAHRQFYEKLIEGDALPTTSQINPTQFEEAFRRAVDEGEDVVAVVLSSKLSGTCQSARIAAEEFPGRVFVVDSENATIGQQILVRRALDLLDQGLDAAAIAGELEREKKDIRLVALLDTLEYLKRGGRISPSVALVGGLLSVKPVIAVEHGEVVMLGKARGSKNGSNLLVQEIRKTNGVDFDRPYLLGYTGLEDSLLQKYIADSAALWAEHTNALPIGTIGGTIGTHVGPGAVAVAFFQRSEP